MIGPSPLRRHRRGIGRFIRAIALAVGLAPVASNAAIVQYAFDPNTTSLFGGYDPHTGIRTGPQADAYSGSFSFDTSTGMIVAQNAAITITGDGPGGSPIPYNVAPSDGSGLDLTHADLSQLGALGPGVLFVIVEFSPSLTGTSPSAVRLVVDYNTDAMPLVEGYYFDDTSAVTGGVSVVPASVSAVPEPSSLLALATGAGIVFLTRRSARRSKTAATPSIAP